MLKLASGEFFGGTLRRMELFGSPMTLTSYPPGDSYPWHVHESPTLFILLCGHHHNENRQWCFDQRPLTVAFHPTDGPHATYVGPQGMIGINFELSDACLDRCALRKKEMLSDYRLLEDISVGLLALRFAVLSCDAKTSEDGAIETVALELVSCLLRDPGADIGRRPPRWIDDAQQYLRANASNPAVRLSELASEVGVHPVYCARAFRRALNCTVTSYLQALRLIEAGRLILDRRHNLAEVALRVGFADQAHLTRICSRELGFTPGRLQSMRRGWFERAGSGRSRNPGGSPLGSSDC